VSHACCASSSSTAHPPGRLAAAACARSTAQHEGEARWRYSGLEGLDMYCWQANAQSYLAARRSSDVMRPSACSAFN